MKYVFIVNPVAGKDKVALSIVPKVTRLLKEKGIQYSVEATQYPGHASLLVQKYAEQNEEMYIYACGGDGTLNEVVNGAYGYKNVAVGCIPCGTGNDFVRSLGTERDFLSAKSILDVKEMVIDLMKTPDGIAMNICSAGIDAAVAHRVPKYKKVPFIKGETAYKLSVVENLLRRLGHEITIQVDEETFYGEFLLVAIANGTTYGGGFIAAPFADLKDGKLEIILIKKMPLTRIAKVLSQYQKGEHFTGREVADNLKDVVVHRTAGKVAICGATPFIVNADGETYPRVDYEVSVIPNAMRFLIPEVLEEK